MVLLLKIESDTVTKNNGPIRRDLEESQVYKKEWEVIVSFLT